MSQESSTVPDWPELQERIRAFNRERDWEQYHDPKSLLLALVGELGELAAHFQWLSAGEGDAVKQDPVLHETVSEEMADVTIYLLTLADRLDIDLPAACLAKMAINETRYPVTRSRGRNVKYTNL